MGNEHLIRHFLIALASLLFFSVPALAQSPAPCQWNYSFNGGMAQATYCGQVVNQVSIGIWDARSFGANSSNADNTSQIQACLNAAGAIGSDECLVTGARYKVLGNLEIPAGTTLSCGWAMNDRENNVSNFNTQPAILLDAGHTIFANGESASINKCLVLRNGISFPVTDASLYTGIAISDQNNGNFSVKNSVVIGFATCIYGTGTRPYWVHDFVDCAGKASEATLPYAAVELDNSNTDLGYVWDLKIQSLGNELTAPCSGIVRPGTGFRLNGIDAIGDIIAQNFQTADVELIGLALGRGFLWTDFPPSCVASEGATSIGLIAGGQVELPDVQVNGTNTGILMDNGDNQVQSWIGSVQFNNVAQDCIQFGTSSKPVGLVDIGSFTTNAASATNCGRYAVNYLDASASSILHIHTAFFKGINGGASPQINLGVAGIRDGYQISIDQFVSTINGALMGGTNLLTNLSVASAAQIDIPQSGNDNNIVLTGTANITQFNNVYPGEKFSFIMLPSGPTITAGNDIILAGGVTSRTATSAVSVDSFACFNTGSAVQCKETAFNP